ncbi:TIGR01777 family oxidoreductase [Olivibacter ginsenosidimutans]|uniref:TIGR01777 family oxidoreductase n=1 Tax=Olivibacter ginsenosidimutans TaxID=1176537 RepID=A0ABP9AQ02_9SPHI
MPISTQHTVLITGASGMVGQALIRTLVEKGYRVHALVRTSIPDTQHIRYFFWDVEKNIIDQTCIANVETIIHLAGAPIGKLPWSSNIRKQILNSRIDSLALVYKLLSTTEHDLKTLISASATGYYGHRGNEWLTEDQAPADDFLGQTCLAWEQLVAQGKLYGLRTVSLRTGIVLAKDKGALPLIASSIKKGFGAALGTGNQYLPWIHLEDVVQAYLFALEHDDLQGAYNLTAPEAVTNKQFTKAIADLFQKPLWLPSIPAFLLRMVLGKMSELLLDSARISPQKIIQAGFQFKYSTLEAALHNILGKA